MYIKQIIIQGFKSYKDQTVMEPFSPGTNVVVGRNGSGKSNFFAAIRFVLGDAYNNLSREGRQGLLHEGSGSAVMSAYVEIIFDNSDKRFATPGDEVVIRRTIGLKKDEYSLDKKAVPRSEVMDLLEGAGFSRSNSYFIVPQGKVADLTKMNEKERLELLKNIAGTNTYETRRTESLKIMNDTMTKREKIDELLNYINERLSELEEEKEELRGFQEKDKERRCLEYALYHRLQEKAKAQLDEIDAFRQEGVGASNQEREELQRCEKEIEAIDDEIKGLRQQLEILAMERRQLDGDRKSKAKTLASAEMTMKSLDDTRDSRQQAQKQQAAELQNLQQSIQKKEQEIAKITPQLEKRQAEEREVKQQLDLTESKKNRLLSKQSRGNQFSNKKERDAYLRAEIDQSRASIATSKAVTMELQESIREDEEAIERVEEEIQATREEIAGFPAEQEKLAEAGRTAQTEMERLSDKRMLLRREQDKINKLLNDTRRDLQQAEGQLRKGVDFATWRGLESIQKLKEQKNIPGAYGYLAELMDVPQDTYKVAVEQVAGGSLFHYVVDDQKTATEIGEYLYKNNLGRPTFIPLAQIRPPKANLPNMFNVQPLMDKIRFDDKYKKAFQQVFGRSVVCPDLKIGGQLARNHGVEGVTLSGERTNKRGAITGGFIDSKSSRLDTVRKVMKLREISAQYTEELEKIRQEMEVLDQEITVATSEVRKADVDRRRLSTQHDSLKHELQIKESQRRRITEHLEKTRANLDRAEQTLVNLDNAIENMQTELATEYKKALTADEESQLEDLRDQGIQLHKQWNEASKKRRELQSRKRTLETDINENLQPQVDQLSSQAFEESLTVGGGSSDKDAKRELQRAKKAMEDIERQLQQNDKSRNEKTSQTKKLEEARAEKEQLKEQLAANVEKQRKRIEKNGQKRALFNAQVGEYTKIIRDLGVIPEEAFTKYERMKQETIDSRMKKVMEALKKYKNINKKAFEQYTSFTTQQEMLLKRRKELDAGQGSIEELIEHLDQAKDEAIERTFKQVSKEFSEIFERLVPAGHGRLVIHRKADRNRGRNDDDSDDEHRGGLENYTGVDISVSFNSKTADEQQKIQQLSGGQKSLCSLCLIFAIQATETSPMVIFDEVDANLDAQYRTAVASLLESTSRDAGTQFICTTFRPEIVLVADKCYGVTFRNKSSTIDCVPTEDALNFVEGQKR